LPVKFDFFNPDPRPPDFRPERRRCLLLMCGVAFN